MKSLVLFAVCVIAATCLIGNASAQELRGRLAVTGKLGAEIPAQGEENNPAGKLIVDTDTGFIGGGGLLYGVDDSLALELEITRAFIHTSTHLGWGTADVKDLSMGVEYRFPESQRIVPYGAAGADVVITDLDSSNVSAVDTVFGAHLGVGLDYILTRSFSLTGELRGVEAFNADVKSLTGSKLGEYDPSNVSITVGARFFFN